eukprot:Hpha_TRINITY_DN15857_c3_g3::TRINITY_DN15857_c3_g3_i6::g.190631::m.190631
MDYKHPTDARPWVLHALRCPTLRRTLSGEYLEAFKRVLGVEQKKNKAKNTAQKRRKHEAQMKRDGLREDALFSFLQCSPPPAVESGGSNQPVAVPKRTRNARADPQLRMLVVVVVLSLQRAMRERCCITVSPGS